MDALTSQPVKVTPGTSELMDALPPPPDELSSTSKANDDDLLTSSERVSILTFSPFPKAIRLKIEGSEKLRRKGKAEVASVLTSSPYQQSLMDKMAAIKPAKPASKKLNTSSRAIKPTRRVLLAESKLKKSVVDYFCIYCNVKCDETNHEEDWLKCRQCERWCHESCAPIKRGKVFCL